MVTLITLLGADTKFVRILVSVPYVEFCVPVNGYQCSVIYVPSTGRSLHSFCLNIEHS